VNYVSPMMKSRSRKDGSGHLTRDDAARAPGSRCRSRVVAPVRMRSSPAIYRFSGFRSGVRLLIASGSTRYRIPLRGWPSRPCRGPRPRRSRTQAPRTDARGALRRAAPPPGAILLFLLLLRVLRFCRIAPAGACGGCGLGVLRRAVLALTQSGAHLFHLDERRALLVGVP